MPTSFTEDCESLSPSGSQSPHLYMEILIDEMILRGLDAETLWEPLTWDTLAGRGSVCSTHS